MRVSGLKIALLTVGSLFELFPLAEAFLAPKPEFRVVSVLASTAVDAGVELARSVHPSVALVTPIGVRNMKTRGSGFVVLPHNTSSRDSDTRTYLITAAHVAAPGYEIGLAFPSTSNTTIKATVVRRNQTLDLALLRIEHQPHITPLKIASQLPPVGTTAFAHGYPATRLQGPAMTKGIVCGIAEGLGMPQEVDYWSNANTTTAPSSPFDDTIFVVTDAAMSGGMSGGPLTDSQGQVIGVNALIRPDLRALGNYAVSSHELSSFLNAMAKETMDDLAPQSTFQLLLFNDPMNKKVRIEFVFLENCSRDLKHFNKNRFPQCNISKERVSNLLQTIANLDTEKAMTAMMQAHTTGTGLIAQFDNKAQAEELCQALRKEDLLVEVP
jgi:S1-C subfamily serine protease